MMDNVVFNEDCLETMSRFEDKCIDVALTDPPYNVGKQYSEHNDNMIDYYEWCNEWFDELMRVSKVVFFTPGTVNLKFWMSKDPLWVMCWFKPNQCSRTPIGGFNVWEPIMVFGRPNKRIPQDGFSMPVIQDRLAGGHPCPKSLKAWRTLLLMISNEGDLVYDPFIGVGTTAIACIKENRRYIGSEIDRNYYNIAMKKINAELSQLNLFGR